MNFRTDKKENPFAQIDKRYLKSPDLSWKAKGLISYLLSKPDDWKLVVKDLMNSGTDGKGSVHSGINELIDNGYISTHRRHNDDGTFAGLDYDIFEHPDLNDSKPQPKKPEPDNPHTENPDMAKNDLNTTTQKSGNGSESKESITGKPERGLESNQATTQLTGAGKTGAGKSAPTNNDLTNNELNNKKSLETDSDEPISCLSDGEAYDFDLIDLSPSDYPKSSKGGKILRFTIWFHQQVMKTFPDHKSSKQANLFTWREHIRLLVEQDDISLDRQLEVARWVFSDAFWKTVIRSTGNFREEWEDIDAAILRKEGTKKEKTKKRRKFTRHEGELLMVDNGLVQPNSPNVQGREFDDIFEKVDETGPQPRYVIKKSCLNLFKKWNR